MKKKYLMIIIMILGVSAAANGYAQSGESSDFMQKVERLRQLKESNPEAYQSLIAEKKRNVRERFKSLKQENPEKFQNFTERHSQGRRQRLKQLKQTDPEQFQAFMDQRMQRFSEKAEKNPERFQKMLANNPRLRQRFEKFQNKRSIKASESSFQNQPSERLRAGQRAASGGLRTEAARRPDTGQDRRQPPVSKQEMRQRQVQKGVNPEPGGFQQQRARNQQRRQDNLRQGRSGGAEQPGNKGVVKRR